MNINTNKVWLQITLADGSINLSGFPDTLSADQMAQQMERQAAIDGVTLSLKIHRGYRFFPMDTLIQLSGAELAEFEAADIKPLRMLKKSGEAQDVEIH